MPVLQIYQVVELFFTFAWLAVKIIIIMAIKTGLVLHVVIRRLLVWQMHAVRTQHLHSPAISDYNRLIVETLLLIQQTVAEHSSPAECCPGAVRLSVILSKRSYSHKFLSSSVHQNDIVQKCTFTDAASKRYSAISTIQQFIFTWLTLNCCSSKYPKTTLKVKHHK